MANALGCTAHRDAPDLRLGDLFTLVGNGVRDDSAADLLIRKPFQMGNRTRIINLSPPSEFVNE